MRYHIGRMDRSEHPIRRLVIRTALVAALFWGGWRLIPKEGSWDALVPILIALGLFLAGACILALPLAEWSAGPWGSLYFPNEAPRPKAPMYGIPQARRKKGQYEEAMEAYEAITREHPDQLRAWVEMMDMAVVDLRDVSRAETIYERAAQNLQNEDDRRALSAMHRAITSRFASRPAVLRR